MNKNKDILKNKKKVYKVFVGMSGGVDSSVSALLLKNMKIKNFEKFLGFKAPKDFGGFSVSGVFIKAWSPEGFPCTAKEDRRSAMRACAVLDIPFFTLNLEKEYKKEVVDYMIDEYKNGNTPNPDVMCNKQIKFGHFLDFAKRNNADFVATGHYARKIEIFDKKSGNNFYQLKEGLDKNKDQSYFLCTLNQEQLGRALFPIGNLEKGEVREIALKNNLPQATRKDSQGLCFLGKIDIKEFLSKYIETKIGDVLNLEGGVIGKHNGSFFYTIGERHGFTIKNKTNSDLPLYVVDKDMIKNTITVAPKKTYLKEIKNGNLLKMANINILSEKDFSKKIQCRLRYRQEKIKCFIRNYDLKNKRIEMVLENPIFDFTKGQSAVFYDGEVCI